MQKKRKSYILISSIIMLLFTLLVTGTEAYAAQQTIEGAEYSYNIVDGGAIITGVNQTREELIFPDTLGVYPVVAIGENTLIWNTTIKRVTLPDTVMRIEAQAFFGCTNLEEVNVGSGLKEIGKNSFNDCAALTKINFPNSLKKIDSYAFLNCSSLKSIDLPEEVDISGDCIFSLTGLTSLTIPGSVKVVGRDFGSYCYSLEKLTIDEGVKEIGERAFANCYELKSVAIPDSVDKLGLKAFCYDNSLENITLGKGIREIGLRTITECFDLEKITFNEELATIGEAACEDNPQLKSVYIPSSVTSIEGIGLTHYPDIEQFRIIVKGHAGSYAQKWAENRGFIFREVSFSKPYTDKPPVTVAKKPSAETTSIDPSNFPDENFRKYVSGFDKDRNTALSATEIAAVTKIEVPAMEIKTLKGIELFTGITYLDCGLNELTQLDVSENAKLRILWCSDNNIAKLDVSNNTMLAVLWCGNNELTALDVSKNLSLYSLSCPYNQLTDLNISNLKALKELSCSGNKLTKMNVSNNTLLYSLNCYDNILTQLDITNNTVLGKLYCGYNSFTTVDTSKNPELTHFNIAHCHDTLTSLNLSKNTRLVMLHVSDNYAIKEIDAGNLSELQQLFCSAMSLERIVLNKAASAQSNMEGDFELIYKDTGKSVSSEVKSGNGIEANFAVKLDDGRELQSMDYMIGSKTPTAISIYLNQVPLSGGINGYSFSFRRYGEGEVKVKLKVKNARIELPSGETYTPDKINGDHILSTEQNTWDDSAVYVIGGFWIDINKSIPSYNWQGGVFKADIAIEGITQ